jgi:hypothetical protein
MMAVLKVSLEQEHQAREQLDEKLQRTQADLKTREELLSEREARIRASQETLRGKSEEALRLAQERAALEAQVAQTRSTLSQLQTQLAASTNEAQLSRQQLAAMEADLRRRQQELASAVSEAQFSKERLAQMDADLRKRQEACEAVNSEARVAKGVLESLQEDLRKQHQQALQLQSTLSKVEQERAATEAEKQLLAGRLQVVETERKLAHEQVQAERTEKARLMDTTSKLTEGVQQLAKQSENIAEKSDVLAKKSELIVQKSEAIRNEIQQSRPIAPNTFYAEFLTNRVTVSVATSRPGLVSRVDRNSDAHSVLVSDGTNTFALVHIEDTPLELAMPGTDWDRLMVTLRTRQQIVSVPELRFWAYDPRVLLIPVDPVRVKALGSKVYPLATDPHKFPEAILVGTRDSYYGECAFQLDPEHRQYVRMDRNLFRRLAGNFSPSRGDLVFGKNGQVLGVMVNKEYCAVVHTAASMATFRTGVVVQDQRTGSWLAAMRKHLDPLPIKLQ